MVQGNGFWSDERSAHVLRWIATEPGLEFAGGQRDFVLDEWIVLLCSRLSRAIVQWTWLLVCGVVCVGV
jgi:hypothetical protein